MMREYFFFHFVLFSSLVLLLQTGFGIICYDSIYSKNVSRMRFDHDQPQTFIIDIYSFFFPFFIDVHFYFLFRFFFSFASALKHEIFRHCVQNVHVRSQMMAEMYAKIKNRLIWYWLSSPNERRQSTRK